MITNTNSTMMAPGVDQDLDHGQEVGLGEEEDGGHVEEREHQQQQRVDDVLAGDGAQGAGHDARTAKTMKRIFSAIAQRPSSCGGRLAGAAAAAAPRAAGAPPRGRLHEHFLVRVDLVGHERLFVEQEVALVEGAASS